MTPPAQNRAPAAEWAGRRVCVAGIGLSGVAAAEALLRVGALVTVVDERAGDPERTRAAALRLLGADVRLGPAAVATPPPGVSLVVTSPGWRPTQPLLAAAASGGAEVYGEPELAWRLQGGPSGPAWVAVTGTNGKTTTVGMLASILTAAGFRTVAAGNVGTPLTQAALADPPYDVLAVELSSFQLHWSTTIAPVAGALLNVAEDHLDWHGSFEAYAADKAKIWTDACCGVYNADDRVATRLSTRLERAHGFTLGEPGPGQLGVVDGLLADRVWGLGPGEPDILEESRDFVALAAVSDLTAAGPHNVANALAAAALARMYGGSGWARLGVSPRAVRAGLRGYRPGGHRNTPVAVVGGVAYVDDSKATNPHAALASLAAYDRPVWIAGGLLKGADVDELVRAVAPRLRAAVLLGRDRARIAAALARHAPRLPVVEVAVAETGPVLDAAPDGERAVMTEVVRAAAGLARPGDTVLLAPAAASMDQFRDYAARGDAFAAAVRALAADDPVARP